MSKAHHLCRFDDKSWQWQKNTELNFVFLRTQQAYFNHRLQSQGHVFLNEIHDALGLPRTKSGQIVGWIKQGGNPVFGDGYIEFKLGEVEEDGGIPITFNIYGLILDYLDLEP